MCTSQANPLMLPTNKAILFLSLTPMANKIVHPHYAFALYLRKYNHLLPLPSGLPAHKYLHRYCRDKSACSHLPILFSLQISLSLLLHSHFHAAGNFSYNPGESNTFYIDTVAQYGRYPGGTPAQDGGYFLLHYSVLAGSGLLSSLPVKWNSALSTGTFASSV